MIIFNRIDFSPDLKDIVDGKKFCCKYFQKK